MTDKPSKDFLEHAYSDEDAEEDEETIRERQILKECFKMEDFLEFPDTREIMEQEFRWKFEKELEPKLEAFWEKQVDMCRNQGSTLFDNEIDFSHVGDFIGTVFNYLKTNYDLEIFYDNPSLAKNMVNTYNARKQEQSNQRMVEIRENYKKSSENANKKFDWTTKSYKNN
jgi:hypothetical protein